MPTWRRTIGAYAENIWSEADVWHAWWSPSGRSELEVFMTIDSEAEGGPGKLRPTVDGRRLVKQKAGRRRCEAWLTRVNQPDLDVVGQVEAAEADTRWMFEQVRLKYGLAEVPHLSGAQGSKTG